MKILKDIPFRPGSGISGLCDLYLPDRFARPDIAVLMIHGGGWNSLTKDSLEGVARWLCEDLGLPVCNTNYRLSGEAPWPACGDDCLAAARYLMDTDKIPGDPARRKLLVVGGSSGGHLALMTGLRLPPGKVAGIISISGIADLNPDRCLTPGRYTGLFGHEPDEAEIRAASPSTYLTPDSPPVLCTHERHDNVVPIRAAQNFLDAVRRNGTVGESFFYDKDETGYSHRIWIPGSAPHRLYPEIEAAVAAFIARCIDKSK
ncbi:MAG: alpha/beta hydrolase [Lentisphaeria bacterium]|nr:alpha/beta hydrolase [Lentisphaeria bacterium]